MTWHLLTKNFITGSFSWRITMETSKIFHWHSQSLKKVTRLRTLVYLYNSQEILVPEFGVTTTIDLIPDGSNIPVTQENRLQYIYFMCYHHLVQRMRKQSDAFFKGLSEIIDSNWLRYAIISLIPSILLIVSQHFLACLINKSFKSS